MRKTKQTLMSYIESKKKKTLTLTYKSKYKICDKCSLCSLTPHSKDDYVLMMNTTSQYSSCKSFIATKIFKTKSNIKDTHQLLSIHTLLNVRKCKKEEGEKNSKILRDCITRHSRLHEHNNMQEKVYKHFSPLDTLLL